MGTPWSQAAMPGGDDHGRGGTRAVWVLVPFEIGGSRGISGSAGASAGFWGDQRDTAGAADHPLGRDRKQARDTGRVRASAAWGSSAGKGTGTGTSRWGRRDRQCPGQRTESVQHRGPECPRPRTQSVQGPGHRMCMAEVTERPGLNTQRSLWERPRPHRAWWCPPTRDSGTLEAEARGCRAAVLTGRLMDRAVGSEAEKAADLESGQYGPGH